MEFIALLILIGLRYRWPFFEAPAAQCGFSRLTSGNGSVVIGALVPALLVGALDISLRQVAWGLPSLLLAVAALWFACGRADALRILDCQRSQLRENALESAIQTAREAGSLPDTSPLGIDDLLTALQRPQAEYYLHQWFAPVLWFCLLGPAGAVGYRLIYLAGSGNPQPLQLASWLPSRLLALSFSLTGNLYRAYPAAREQMFDEAPASLLVDQCANAALPDGDSAIPASGPALDARLAQREALFHRTRLLWLSAIALGVIAI